MALVPSARLGPYQIRSALGAGGMGEVYRARDTRLERDVAIKVLPAHLSDASDALARFEREAKALAALSHPNILAIHDVGKNEAISYVVMELLEGETLRARLTRSSLPWRKAVDIAAAVADGLSAAHAKGISHRDLKPENIFLTVDGRVKILDFGLASVRAVASPSADSAPTAAALTQQGIVMGTIGYMSPEQVRGDMAAAASDIFSLGRLGLEDGRTRVSERAVLSARLRADSLVVRLFSLHYRAGRSSDSRIDDRSATRSALGADQYRPWKSPLLRAPI